MKILQGEVGFDINLDAIQGLTEFAINSYGGSLFEGLALYDYIKNSGVNVGVIGLAASAATLPLLASSKRWGTPNSRYLIHNPSNFAGGEAKDLQKTADQLKAEEARALNLYAENFTIDKDEIKTLMDAEIIIDATEALRIGLITEIKEFNPLPKNSKNEGSTINQLFTNFKMQIEMNEAEKNELSGIRLALDGLINLFKKSQPKMVVVQDVNGIELDFADVETSDLIKVGDNATVEGLPAIGEYVMQTGETFKFESGAIVEIVVPEVEADPLVLENEALKAENEALKEQVQNSATELDKIKNQVSDVETKFNDFKNKFSDEKAEDVKPEVSEEKQKTNRVSFNFNKKNK